MPAVQESKEPAVSSYLQTSTSGIGIGTGIFLPRILACTTTHSNLQYFMLHDGEPPPHDTRLLAVQFAKKASIIPAHEAKMIAIHFFRFLFVLFLFVLFSCCHLSPNKSSN